MEQGVDTVSCFLIGLLIIVGVLVGLFLLMALIGAPVFRIWEGRWPEVDDLLHSITYGYFSLCILAVLFLIAMLATAIGCFILGR